MANVRDSDTCLWLHNKLGISNDSWTGGSICSQLNAEVLSNIKECFPDLQTQVKLKLLLSFFHIPRRNLEEWKIQLESILDVGVADSELWVAMIAEALKTLPSTGSLNTEIADLDEVRPIFTDLLSDLRRLVRKQSEANMLPMECHYLNKGALVSLVGNSNDEIKHFTLRKKQKSASLRNELLQKSSDAASNLKKSSAPVIPVRSRGMPRKMTDTTPLKGIPSRVPSSGFRGNIITNTLKNRPAGRKEGGVKLLDIADQPLGFAASKKRKKLPETEDSKKPGAPLEPQPPAPISSPPSVSATPDYAVGLTSHISYVPPQSVAPLSDVAPIQSVISVLPPELNEAPPTPGVVQNVSQIQTHQVASLQIPTTAIRPIAPLITSAKGQPAIIAQRPQQTTPTVTHIRIQPQPTVNTLQRRGLALTREQMLEAQDMFRTANKVTRPEKALILGFMAGSRDNPCPHLGNIVTIKLSEDQENVQQPDDTYLTMMVETHFQMNYNNGEWKRIKKYRHLDNSGVDQLVQNFPPVQ